MARILSIGPDRNALVARNQQLSKDGHNVLSADTRARALALAKTKTFEVILLCDRFLPAYAAGLADELRILAPEASILVLAGRPTPLTLLEIQALVPTQVIGPRAA